MKLKRMTRKQLELVRSIVLFPEHTIGEEVGIFPAVTGAPATIRVWQSGFSQDFGINHYPELKDEFFSARSEGRNERG